MSNRQLPLLSRRDYCRQWLALLASSPLMLASGKVLGQEPAEAADDEPGEKDSSAETVATSRLTFVDPKTSRYRCGLDLDTRSAACRGIITTFPVPRVWPEQEVQLMESNVGASFNRWQTRDLDGLVSQFVGEIASLRPNSVVQALFTFQLTRFRIVAPEKTDDLVIPKKIEREMRQFTGSSPYIDPGSARIRNAVREIDATAPQDPWHRIEAVYDWVREKINYVEGDIKSADEALKDGTGDCEELTSVFVAILRAMRIPARMVHVLMHCYPEFYLEDGEGNGHWFPCQAAGTRQFGCMEEYRPILQKGDRFKTPEQPLRRYVSEFFKANAVQGGKPSPKFVQELLD